MKIKLKDLEIGQRFWYNNKMYIRVEVGSLQLFVYRLFGECICVLEVNSCKLVMFNKDLLVEVGSKQC